MEIMEPGTNQNNEQHFFEGVEKLLEVWFTRKDGKVNNSDLRKVPRSKWEEMLKIVRCEIISFNRNESIDAYVLSESSMFVSKRRFILKTCGTTTPLLCLKFLLTVVQRYAGFDEVQDLFYSRKNYKRPELQQEPHRNFPDEVALLDEMFPDGAAYCLGAVNRDCWYLYTLNPVSVANRPLTALLHPSAAMDDQFGDGLAERIDYQDDADAYELEDSLSEDSCDSDSTSNLRSMVVSAKGPIKEADQTLEIMMTDLDPEVMKIFTKQVSKSATEATLKSGIDKILPNVTIDDYLFDPCGYSMNGVMKNGAYMTIHITPEAEFSYVSFESNIPQSSYKEVILRVLQTFRPGKFILTAFANKASVVEDTHKDLLSATVLGEFLRRDIQYCHLKNYDLTYALYSKFPS